MVSLKLVSAIILVYVSCVTTVVLLEHLIKIAPGSGDLITFMQFIFIASDGFINVAGFGTNAPNVPIKEYAFGSLLFLITTLTGNLSFGFNIPMPLQMLFKSGSILASMILGVIYFKRRYSLTKYIAVVMITVGIAMSLLVNAEGKKTNTSKNDSWTWLIGVLLLTVSLFSGARLGVAQEEISLKYGRHPKEMLFYTHVLSLPWFLFFGSRIYNQLNLLSTGDTFNIPYLNVNMTLFSLYLCGNVVAQYICIRNVYVLATELSSLAVTVILTTRKFISLLFSIYYFSNPFTIYHWAGTFLVFTGTLLFTETLQKILNFRAMK